MFGFVFREGWFIIFQLIQCGESLDQLIPFFGCELFDLFEDFCDGHGRGLSFVRLGQL